MTKLIKQLLCRLTGHGGVKFWQTLKGWEFECKKCEAQWKLS